MFISRSLRDKYKKHGTAKRRQIKQLTYRQVKWRQVDMAFV